MSAYQDIARFGVDGRPGLDLTGRVITGPRVIGERVAARLLRDRGAAWWAPDTGAGVGRWLNHDFRAGELDQLAGLIRREAEDEDGVRRASVEVTAVENGIEITVSITTDEGPVELNVDASGAVAILAPGGIL
jgi:hypothetical protein